MWETNVSLWDTVKAIIISYTLTCTIKPSHAISNFLSHCQTLVRTIKLCPIHCTNVTSTIKLYHTLLNTLAHYHTLQCSLSNGLTHVLLIRLRFGKNIWPTTLYVLTTTEDKFIMVVTTIPDQKEKRRALVLFLPPTNIQQRPVPVSDWLTKQTNEQ